MDRKPSLRWNLTHQLYVLAFTSAILGGVGNSQRYMGSKMFTLPHPNLAGSFLNLLKEREVVFPTCHRCHGCFFMVSKSLIGKKDNFNSVHILPGGSSLNFTLACPLTHDNYGVWQFWESLNYILLPSPPLLPTSKLSYYNLKFPGTEKLLPGKISFVTSTNVTYIFQFSHVSPKYLLINTLHT